MTEAEAPLRTADARRLRVVVVTHESASTIAECLGRLLRADGVGEIVVIDNGSRDDTVDRVMPFAQSEARLTLRCDPDNPGFATACNAGAAGCTLRWLAFVNPDCFVEPDTFVRLLDAAGDIADPGAIGCVQVDAQGREDDAVRRRDPSLRAILSAAGGRGALRVAGDGKTLQPVEALSGALLVVPRSVFEQIGGFDTAYRLHVEDLDLCRRIRIAGFAVCIANQVRVIHVRGVSSRRRPVWVEWQKHRGMWRYFSKFEAPAENLPTRVLLRAALWAHFAIAAPRAWIRTRLG